MNQMEKQGVNPYLPSWEYVPDAEPHIFEGRLYIYGSHDRFNGYAYCQNDYVCWSASPEDLSDWRYEGVIYSRKADPRNEDGDGCLYAPDVARGPDGRYYLFYVLDNQPVISVAVCSSPAGTYEFYGYVRDKDGGILGERPGDEGQFDPAVLVDDDQIWLYSGYCGMYHPQRKGPMVMALEPDMLTLKTEPKTLIPSAPWSQGTGFENHAFFEASSMRKIKGNYYFIYSSQQKHELCYAISSRPDRDFTYGGVIISNCDHGIDSYKPAEFTTAYGGNNHGSLIEAGENYYIFYHRHTNGMNYCRQGCIEPVEIKDDGRISQVELTTSGPNGKPLIGEGTYGAWLACCLFCREPSLLTAPPGGWMDDRFPKITQEGKDGEENPGYIANMRDGAVAGFKYFSCSRICRIGVTVRGKAEGKMEVLTALDQSPAGEISLGKSNEWKTYEAEVQIPDGVWSLYFRYRGKGYVSMASFSLMK